MECPATSQDLSLQCAVPLTHVLPGYSAGKLSMWELVDICYPHPGMPQESSLCMCAIHIKALLLHATMHS